MLQRKNRRLNNSGNKKPASYLLRIQFGVGYGTGDVKNHFNSLLAAKIQNTENIPRRKKKIVAKEFSDTFAVYAMYQQIKNVNTKLMVINVLIYFINFYERILLLYTQTVFCQVKTLHTIRTIRGSVQGLRNRSILVT